MTNQFYYISFTHSSMTIAEILSFYLTSSFFPSPEFEPQPYHLLYEKIEAID